jgi:hypothetical protein
MREVSGVTATTTGSTGASRGGSLFPVFKRRLMAFGMENYYAVNTDVWVFGSARQYETFGALLTRGTASKTLVADPGRGMDLLVLPPARQARKDFIVLHERLVHQAGRFNMELIIGGSRKGLQALAEYFRHAATELTEDLNDHDHLDDSEKLLVLPSVFLNIRGPLSDIESRLKELAPPAAEDLPPDIRVWRDAPELWPYSLLAYRDLHARLPLRRRFGRRRRRRSKQPWGARAE